MSSSKANVVAKMEEQEPEMAEFCQIHTDQKNQGSLEGAPYRLPEPDVWVDADFLKSIQNNQGITKEEKPDFFPPIEDVAENSPAIILNQAGAGDQMRLQKRPVPPPPGFELLTPRTNQFPYVSNQQQSEARRPMPQENTRLSSTQLYVNPSNTAASYPFHSLANMTSLNSLNMEQNNRQINMNLQHYINQQQMTARPEFNLLNPSMNQFPYVSNQQQSEARRPMQQESTRLSSNQLYVNPSNRAGSYPFQGLAGTTSLNSSNMEHNNRQINMIPQHYINQKQMTARPEFNLLNQNMINTHQSQATISGSQDAYYNNLLYSGMPPTMYSNQLIPAQAVTVTAKSVAPANYPSQNAAPQINTSPPLMYYNPGQAHRARRRSGVQELSSNANQRNRITNVATGREDQVVPQTVYNPPNQSMDQMAQRFLGTLNSTGNTNPISSSPQLYRRRGSPPPYKRYRGNQHVDRLLRSNEAYVRGMEEEAQNNRNVGNNSQNLDNQVEEQELGCVELS